MQFSEKELKTIEKLRKRQRQWPIERWIFLATSICLCAITGFWLWMGIHFIHPLIQSENYLFDSLNQQAGKTDDKKMEQLILQQIQICNSSALLISILFPVWLIFAVASLIKLADLIFNWRGNIKDSILIKLIDAQNNQSDKTK